MEIQKCDQMSDKLDSLYLANNLVEWFRRNGGFFSHDIQICHCDSHGYHAKAVRPLTSPAIISCPLRLTFSSLNLDPNSMDVPSLDSPLHRCLGKISTQVLTYLLLVEQRVKGESSPWHDYIACLPHPKSMTTPLWFSVEDETFLTGTDLESAARDRKEELHRQWEDAIKIMRELDINVTHFAEFESFLWAATIFSSRAFVSSHILPNRESIPLLFPVIDLLNHSVSAKIVWDFEVHDTFTLKCVEEEAIRPGDQLFNNYAPKQNGELLLGYGFCLENNPIEQFALKLACPPVLHKYAGENGLLKPENVPFGMQPDFLETNYMTEQHFLRAKDHPFGRYENHVPVFRGIPPFIVHLFFIQSIMKLDLDVSQINIQYPSIQIVLHVLLLLHQAIERRCANLPSITQREVKNKKQRYASIYRDGQAKIIHSIKEELQYTVDRTQTWRVGLVFPGTTLLNTTEALDTLSVEFPVAMEVFKEGLDRHELQVPEDDTVIWILILIVSAFMVFQTPADETLLSQWLHDLFARQKIPPADGVVEDTETYAFIDSHLGDFLRLASFDPRRPPIDALNSLCLNLPTYLIDCLESAQPSISKQYRNFGSRLIGWAMNVAKRELLPVFKNGVVNKCLYVRAWTAENNVREDERWIYRDIDTPGQS